MAHYSIPVSPISLRDPPLPEAGISADTHATMKIGALLPPCISANTFSISDPIPPHQACSGFGHQCFIRELAGIQVGYRYPVHAPGQIALATRHPYQKLKLLQIQVFITMEDQLFFRVNSTGRFSRMIGPIAMLPHTFSYFLTRYGL